MNIPWEDVLWEKHENKFAMVKIYVSSHSRAKEYFVESQGSEAKLV